MPGLLILIFYIFKDLILNLEIQVSMWSGLVTSSNSQQWHGGSVWNNSLPSVHMHTLQLSDLWIVVLGSDEWRRVNMSLII